MNRFLELNHKPILFQKINIEDEKDDLRTPEQIQYEEEKLCNLRLLTNLVSEIMMLGGKNEQSSLLDRLNFVNYSHDTWKTEFDRLTELHKKMKMRETEVKRALISAWVNGHPDRFTFKIKLRDGKMGKFNCDAQSLYEVTELILILTDEYDGKRPPRIMYEDEDGEKIEIASDSDLIEAVKYARSVGLKDLYLDMDTENKGIRTWPIFVLSNEARARDARARAARAKPASAIFGSIGTEVPPLRRRMF